MNLPYFKFEVAKWLTGAIVFEPMAVQGLFINICALYWQKEGKLTLGDIALRYKNYPELELLRDRFFTVENDLVKIEFLKEQFQERKTLSKQNALNGSKGGAAKALKNKDVSATAKRPSSDRLAKPSNKEKKREEKKRKEKIKIAFGESKFFDRKVFAETFSGWSKEKLRYYYQAAERYSSEGNKYVNWDAAIRQWANRDELQGKLKFNKQTHANSLQSTI